MRIEEVRRLLEAQEILRAGDPELLICSACASDLMSDVLTTAARTTVLLTGLTNPQAVRTAEMADIKVICFVRGKRPSSETIELAREIGIPLMSTSLSMLEACGRLYNVNIRD